MADPRPTQPGAAVDSGELLRRSRLASGAPALDDLLARHLGDLRAFVRLNVDGAIRHRESSSDVVQSVCREVLQRADRFEFQGESSFKSWLYGAVLNKIRDRQRFWRAERRDAGREVASEDDELPQAYASLTPSRLASGREELARVEQALDALTPQQRHIITLARLVGLSHAEIAAELGMSEGAVRVALHRALIKLSGILAASDGV